mmetsp:Transcript_12573/g.43429  ORF Transcript_12573/g.43429 Transcript_12573/m.43429 type:complete len:233 (-) Transcript_12573:344-1042(-)
MRSSTLWTTCGPTPQAQRHGSAARSAAALALSSPRSVSRTGRIGERRKWPLTLLKRPKPLTTRPRRAPLRSPAALRSPTRRRSPTTTTRKTTRARGDNPTRKTKARRTTRKRTRKRTRKTRKTRTTTMRSAGRLRRTTPSTLRFRRWFLNPWPRRSGCNAPVPLLRSAPRRATTWQTSRCSLGASSRRSTTRATPPRGRRPAPRGFGCSSAVPRASSRRARWTSRTRRASPR